MNDNTVPQGQTAGKPSSNPRILTDSLVQALEGQIQDMKSIITSAAQDGTPVHIVEQKVWKQVLEMGRRSLGELFRLMGDGDMGKEVVLPDGRKLQRLEKTHPRSYLSIFGEFHLNRVAYGTREGQKIELVPLDQRLGLPESKFSYVLQDWDQRLVVEDSFAQVSDIIERILGFPQSVDSLERMNRTMANPVVDYWDSLESPEPAQKGQVVVASADFKGVPMQRVANHDPMEKFQPSKGPIPGGKKMALLGSVYTVDRFVRRPKEILDALFKKKSDQEDKKKRPVPKDKRIRASLERDDKGNTTPATQEIFGWMGLEVEQRNPQGDKPVVILMDGQESLWESALSNMEISFIGILDLLHVTPRIWEAAHLFYPENSGEAVAFTRKNVARVLEGNVSSVIRGLRRQGTLSHLNSEKRKRLDDICQYLQNNQEAMRYNEYLAEGYPIATGVIEGACRHLVKDRLERTGMLWSTLGAQAMLDLRSIFVSDHWDEFTAFRIEKEQGRLYPYTELTDNIEWKIAA